MPADPSATLEAIKERGKAVWNYRNRLGACEAIEAAKDDFPRLVAALEAALKLHQGNVNGDYPAETPVCGEDGEWVPCPTVLAITRALNGDTDAGHPL